VTPFVTVVIPTRNRRDLLRALLESLQAQTYPADSFEVVVCDNDSDDGTEAMLGELARTTPLALRHVRLPNRGPAVARNHGLGLARGELVAFIDSDCVATPGWLEAAAAAFAPGTGLVQGRTLPNPEQPRHVLEKTIAVTREGPLYETCNIVYRKSAVDAVHGFSESEDFAYPLGGEDTDLAWRVKRHGFASAFADRALVHHHVFRISPWRWLPEPWVLLVWPCLTRNVPELRAHLFARYFLFRATAAFDLALLGLLLALAVHGAFACLGLPYLVVRWIECGRFVSPGLRLARIVMGVARSLVIFAALAYGSVRYRSLVL
jgi:glycosyltransferase involved in cell wall biosynthesis